LAELGDDDGGQQVAMLRANRRCVWDVRCGLPVSRLNILAVFVLGPVHFAPRTLLPHWYSMCAVHAVQDESGLFAESYQPGGRQQQGRAAARHAHDAFR
jgi:hypothetical protein